MKRSKAVTLLTIGFGSFALAACDKSADCNSANRDSQACQQQGSAAHGGGYVATYAGRPFGGSTSSPSTTSEGVTSSPSMSGSAGEAATVRGGFGATGDAATSSAHGGGEGGGGHASAGGHGGGGGE